MTNREKFREVFNKDIHWSRALEPQILALKSAQIDGIDCMEEWLNSEYIESQVERDNKKMPWYLELFKQAIETLESNNDTLEWLGKNCKDCGNEKCKKLGTLPKGYDCALWQSESEGEKCK